MKKKTLAIIIPVTIISLMIASAIFVPMIIYGGAKVAVVEGEVTFESTVSTTSSMSTKAFTPSIGNVQLDLKNKTKNAIAYAYDGINGRSEAPEDNPSEEISLELSIKFIISKDGEIVKEIDIGVTHGEGMHNVTTTLGPSEGFTESGTYELTIQISLKLNTPGTNLDLNIDLGPFEIYFNPPA
ncbi:MAG: hypothetical protein U9O98_07490 [Asgard group archaeon]|nr:hypothetical protein [Asgard group archaeon]